ncbi:MAG: S8 family serine peptidase, partial [Candidatus Thorarchaeota archaeon]
MDDEGGPGPKRGTAVLIISLLFVSAFAVGVALPRNPYEPDLRVRVCIIDSGITKDAELATRIVAEESFINSTYGYNENVNSTHDSMPLYTPHGTYVAKIIAREAPDAAIVNAKVVTVNNNATLEAIVAAIYWAVEEAESDIINLSIGTFAYIQGPLRDAVRWAFRMGVSIVAAAGNNGQGGIAGTSVESPAIYPEVIAVGAVNNRGQPYDFSARGPLRNRTGKPDLSAVGHYSTNGATVYGTSFAAPEVSAAAATLISICEEAGWSWTPGMVKAVLMSTASPLSYEKWEVGAGVLNLERAIEYMTNVERRNGLPLVAALSPG